MKYAKNLLLPVMLILTSLSLNSLVSAQELAPVNLSWNHPSARENGQPLPRAEVKHYVLRVSGEADFIDHINIIVPREANSYTYIPQAGGNLFFALLTVDIDDNIGKSSAPISVLHEGLPPVVEFDGYPNPPSGLIGEISASVTQFVDCELLTVNVRCRNPN